MLLWAVASFCFIFFVRIHISQPYVIIVICTYWRVSFWSILVSSCPLRSCCINLMHAISIAFYVEFLSSLFLVLWLLILSTGILPFFQLPNLILPLTVGLLLYWTLPLSSHLIIIFSCFLSWVHLAFPVVHLVFGQTALCYLQIIWLKYSPLMLIPLLPSIYSLEYFF